MTRREIILSKGCRAEGVSFEERADGRFCLRCEKKQHDFRGATRREVLAVLAREGGRACGQLRIGPGGAPRFVPEPPAKASALGGAMLAVMLAACDSPAEEVAT